jgi:hypothetical protein
VRIYVSDAAREILGVVSALSGRRRRTVRLPGTTPDPSITTNGVTMHS